MRLGGRRFFSVVAIYAIALNAILWGAAGPQVAASPLDPFSVICHSDAAQPGEQSPAGHTPAQTCDHCTLCSAAAPPQAPAATVIIRRAPVTLLQVLRPTAVVLHDGIAENPNRTRGPPQLS
ncbi:MAG: DUF2946 family protein [Pseudolabrys sp.]